MQESMIKMLEYSFMFNIFIVLSRLKLTFSENHMSLSKITLKIVASLFNASLRNVLCATDIKKNLLENLIYFHYRVKE